jgi:predicted nucleotidyltransferase
MKTLHEAKKVPRKAAPLLRQVKRVIRGFLPDATVLLYGSLARGTAGPESDWDILVITERRLTATQEDPIRHAVFGLELDHDVVLSVIFYARSDWESPLHRGSPFCRNVRRQGVLI